MYDVAAYMADPARLPKTNAQTPKALAKVIATMVSVRALANPTHATMRNSSLRIPSASLILAAASSTAPIARTCMIWTARGSLNDNIPRRIDPWAFWQTKPPVAA